MGIKLAPGSLYFLRERDFLTGENSPYVKIGLVRGEKETEKRILEHKTGNPREIIDHKTLEVPFVEHLETMMHYLCANCWVTGEWFLMNERILEEAVAKALKYSAKQLSMKEKFDRVAELESSESNGEILNPTSEDIDLHREFLEARSQFLVRNTEVEIIKNRLLKTMGSAPGIERIVDVQFKMTPPGFDKKRFQAENSELWDQYCSEKINPPRGSFLIKQTSSLKKINPELADELKASKPPSSTAIDKKGMQVSFSEELKEIHEEYIRMLPRRSELEWKMLQLETRLKYRVGDYEWLGELIQWTRQSRTTVEFNRKALEKEHPEIYAEYLTEPRETLSTSVRAFREYLF